MGGIGGLIPDAAGVYRRAEDAVFLKLSDDGRKSVSFQTHPVDPADRDGGDRIDDPVLRVSGKGAVAVYGIGSAADPALLADAAGDRIAAGQVPGIPVVDQVEQRSHHRVGFTGHVHIVHQGDEAYMVFREHLLHVMAGLHIVAAKAGQVPDDNGGYMSLLHFPEHLLKTGTLEVPPGVAVVGEVAELGIPVVHGIGFQDFLLVGNAGGFSVVVLLPGQAFIQCGIGSHGRASLVSSRPLARNRWARNVIRSGASFLGIRWITCRVGYTVIS